MNIHSSYRPARYWLLLFFFLNCSHKQRDEQIGNAGKTFFLSQSGSDANDGTKVSPWKTIDKLNTIQLMPGDSVCFEAGRNFTGVIILDAADAGTSEQPITITSFGTGTAVIDGANGTALTLSKTRYINITNLSFRGSGRKKGNTRDGVIIDSCMSIKIDNLDISGFQKSGLSVNASTRVIAKNVYASDNGFAGIYVGGDYGTRNCSDILISHCTASGNPGDPTNLNNHSGNGILAGYCKNVTIEYCVATNNGWDMPRKGNGPVGIWCYEADSVMIQHCISHENKTSPGSADGGGFDLDGGVTNSVIQYCLSYGNDGSGFGIFQYAGAGDWHDNTIRYCVSENDGNVSPAHAGIFIWNESQDTSQFRNCLFYNNTIYNAKGAAIHYEPQSANAGFRFYNNIFVARDTLIFGRETNSTYLGNNWYSLKTGFNIDGVKSLKTWATANHKETYNNMIVGMNIEPPFFSPGNTTLVSPSQLDTFRNYQLPDQSPLRNNGLDLQKLFGIEPGGLTINGRVGASRSIGACF